MGQYTNPAGLPEIAILKKIRKALSVSTKPDRSSFLESLRITLLGIGVVGLITFVVHILSLVFQFGPS